MRRKDFGRTAAGISGLLIQTVAIAFLTIFEKPITPASEPASELVYIQAIHIPAMTARPSPHRSPKPNQEARSETNGITPETPQHADDAVAPPSLPVDAPAIDWERSMRDSVRRFVDDQAALDKHGHTLNSKPQGLVLPDTSKRPHKAGDTEHFEGGRVITWLNETCYYALDPLGQSGLICKVRSMSERRSEEVAEALEKAVKPKYLSRPLPRPTPPPEPMDADERP